VAVKVEGMEAKTRTGVDGRFVLNGIPPGRVRLRMELPPDFATAVELVEVHAGETTRLAVKMDPVAILLDGLLVRGRHVSSEAVVKRYDGEALWGRGGERTAVDLLAEGFPGVEVNRGGGQVGAGARILIRGANSLSLPGDPLVYLDGVRLGGAEGLGPAGTGGVVGILETIPAGAVDRIEILKGPSSARYGIAAPNGVIMIWTRRGGGG